MEDARALLESLMGPDRNAEIGKERRIRKFTDDDSCRNFLLGLCPHDLFRNTKMDLGPCEKEHNEHLKEDFEADKDVQKYRRKWRRGMITQLRRMLLDVDRLIGKNQERIQREKDGGLGVSAAAEKLKAEASEKLQQAERAADDGNFEESRIMIKDSEATRRKIEDFEAKSFERYKKENICDICGLIVDAEEIEAMKTGRGWHINGKQHLGYKAIRQKLKELDEAVEKDRRNSVPSPTPSPVREMKIAPSSGPDFKMWGTSKRSPKRDKKSRSPKNKSSRSPRRDKKDAKKRSSPSPKRSRSRRGRRDRSRPRRSRSRKKASRSRKAKKSPPKRRKSSSPKQRSSPSREKDKGKASKAKKSEPKPPKDVIPPVPKARPKEEPTPMPMPMPPEPAPMPPPLEEPIEPPEPEPRPDIDEVRPRVAFFMGLKPIR